MKNKWRSMFQNGRANCRFRWTRRSSTVWILCRPSGFDQHSKYHTTLTPLAKEQWSNLCHTLWIGRQRQHWWQGCCWSWNQQRRLRKAYLLRTVRLLWITRWRCTLQTMWYGRQIMTFWVFHNRSIRRNYNLGTPSKWWRYAFCKFMVSMY